MSKKGQVSVPKSGKKLALKKPPNSFAHFVKLKSKKIDGTPTERMKQLGEMWKTCPKAVKQRCEEKAKSDMEIYMAKKGELPAKAKRPLTGYQTFVKEYLNSNKDSEAGQKEVFADAAECWNGLSEIEKGRWNAYSKSGLKSDVKKARKSDGVAKKRKASASEGRPKKRAANESKSKKPAASKSKPKKPAASESKPKKPAASESKPKKPAASKSKPKKPAASESKPKKPAARKTTSSSKKAPKKAKVAAKPKKTGAARKKK